MHKIYVKKNFLIALSSLFCLYLLACFFHKLYYNKKYKDCDHIVSIFNGMANQFMEVSFGIILEKETGKRICYEKSFFDQKNREAHENYMLNHFNVDLNFVDKPKEKLCLPIFRKYGRIGMIDGAFEFHTLDLNKMLSKDGKKRYYSWHYFSEKYFKKYRNDLLKIFKLKTPLTSANADMLKEIKKYKNSVSIHIRRSDYVKLWYFKDVVTIDNYYNYAVKVFDHMDDVHFFVFSDDMEWAKKNLKLNKPTTYVDINDRNHGYFDFELMRNCKHNIVANSTMSHWAGYLNENPNAIVVAPRNWVRDRSNRELQKMTLSNWKIIENKI